MEIVRMAVFLQMITKKSSTLHYVIILMRIKWKFL